jgi:hypothetical protein
MLRRARHLLATAPQYRCNKGFRAAVWTGIFLGTVCPCHEI